MANNMFVPAERPAALTLLVYSRSPGVARYLAAAAQRAGIVRTVVATTYQEAFEAMQSDDPDAVIIHADVRRWDQFFEARRVNKIWKSNRRRTPKIFAVAAPSVGDLTLVRHFGFYDIMPLPTCPGALFSRVTSALENLD
ncbi:hypothetical protein [Caenispirillum bisanense]|uniref:Response regulatory domain-containing protein n=1 Tax=Caenispirillum bisanense TaxID=414052 RepID=A0A286GST7_9PROT|nr:hypothetical protein [Caenispirillum bisanense]SOD98621.1 hypothetical protein SAMN05421508_10829 [Caenispirillum bisanense]